MSESCLAPSICRPPALISECPFDQQQASPLPTVLICKFSTIFPCQSSEKRENIFLSIQTQNLFSIKFFPVRISMESPLYIIYICETTRLLKTNLYMFSELIPVNTWHSDYCQSTNWLLVLGSEYCYEFLGFRSYGKLKFVIVIIFQLNVEGDKVK